MCLDDNLPAVSFRTTLRQNYLFMYHIQEGIQVDEGNHWESRSQDEEMLDAASFVEEHKYDLRIWA